MATVIRYVLYKLAEWMSKTPPRHFAYWLSLRIADAYYFFDRRGRCAVMDNLRQVYAFKGQEVTKHELALVARRAFQNFGKYLVDFFRFSRLSEEEMRRLVVVENVQYVEEARRHGKGVLLVTAHLGNWELGGAVLASMGYPINAVVLRQPSAKLNDFFQRHRRKRGMKIIPLGHAVGSMIRALRDNDLVALLADRDYSLRNDFVRFCGAEACLPRGPAWMAVKTGAPIVAGFMLRRPDDTFCLRMYPPMFPGQTVSREVLQEQIGRILEHAITTDPSQWFMFERVWDGQSYGKSTLGGKEASRDGVGRT